MTTSTNETPRLHRPRRLHTHLARAAPRQHAPSRRGSLRACCLRPLTRLAPPLNLCRIFGWTRKNEITNGRWVMMGIAIGLMTEYATGVSFIDQLRLMASYLGLVDLD